MTDKDGFLNRLRSHFDLMADREDEQLVIDEISRGAVFRGANVWVLIFAIFIASLGLNVNSTAVIIGAMLISPLMGPIIGMGLAVGTNDLDLLKRSFRNYAVATVVSVATATVYFIFTPYKEVQSELLARTSPTLYDVMIAFFGGAAGIVALCTKGKAGNVIPGVAIATALMPPLCTAGFGLATGRFLFFLGAFYLFFINTVFIALATTLGVRLMQFRQHEFVSSARARHARQVLMGVVTLTMIPAAVMTWQIVKNEILDKNVKQFIATELQQKGTQIMQTDIDKDAQRLNIVAIGREITEATQEAARQRMAHYGLGDYQLRVIQGAQSDSIIMLNNELTQATTNREADRRKLLELSAENTELTRRLNEYTSCEILAAELRPELEVLFPQVATLSLVRTAECGSDTAAVAHFTTAIIATNDGKDLPHDDRQRLAQWLKTRTQADSIAIVGK
ncbi:MAG: DUF389 domain-containing protein [Bacteroidaceae bacterium]|nr:DUF389 domain-containing protein [Bacteroidaceae bacterium]